MAPIRSEVRFIFAKAVIPNDNISYDKFKLSIMYFVFVFLVFFRTSVDRITWSVMSLDEHVALPIRFAVPPHLHLQQIQF